MPMQKFFTSFMQFHFFMINWFVKETYFIQFEKLLFNHFSNQEKLVKTKNIDGFINKSIDRFKIHFNTSLDS